MAFARILTCPLLYQLGLPSVPGSTYHAGNKCVLSHSSKRLLRLTTDFEIQTARGMRLEAVSPSMLAQRPDSEPTTHSNLLSHARANSRALGGVEIGPQLAENA